MQVTCRLAIALAIAVGNASSRGDVFLGRVVDYRPGTLPANLASYTNTAAVLGEPSRVTPGDWGGPVDPFNPPYTSAQLLAVGTNGSLTVEFEVPVLNDPRHPSGLDFALFGACGYVITNGDYTGGGITDGSTFGGGAGQPRVSVSADGSHYYPLDPARVAGCAAPWPTDGEGAFARPLPPAGAGPRGYTGSLASLRRAYDGSAGGVGFDLAWARDEQGAPVSLPAIRFVRFESLDGFLKLDGCAAVAPVGDLVERFESDPLARGWYIVGDTNLFHWDASRQQLQATWDSSRENSFFYRPLAWTLNAQDDFRLAFDVTPTAIAAGVHPDKPFAFELAVGLIRRAEAFAPTFRRGTGADSPDLVEFDYFPDTGFGATISTVVAGAQAMVPSFSFPLELSPDSVFHVEMAFTAAERRLHTEMTRDGQPFGPIKDVVLNANFTGFTVDALAVSSYSDAGADGSILATGAIDNLSVTLPAVTAPQLTLRRTANGPEAAFAAVANWSYALERTVNLIDWSACATLQAVSGGPASLTDAQPPAGGACYRLRVFRR